ncbi:MAG: NRDE family protein [Gammaproteobacteria bacterium]|nr:NRDE family protein [Gammaproteobacteria bacterium]
MCLALIAYRAHPRYPLVLAANRDEFHARPAQALHWWKDGVRMLAGRDLQAGGSWLGLDGAGRIALVTNYRDPSLPRPEGTSRGSLIGEFLGGQQDAAGFVRAIASRATQFSGFNLLAMDQEGFGYVTSHPEPEARMLLPGVYGLSNKQLDTPWPKLLRARERFARELAGDYPQPEALMRMLSDRSIASDKELPDTGIGLEWERLLSSAFIVSDGYGTRCSTVVLIGSDGIVTVEERSHAPDGGVSIRVRMAFQI